MSVLLSIFFACSGSPTASLPEVPVEVTLAQILTVGSERRFVTEGRLDGKSVQPRATVHRLTAAPALVRSDGLEGQPFEAHMVQTIDGEVQVEVRNGYVWGPEGVHRVSSWEDGTWKAETPMLHLPPRMKTGDEWADRGRMQGKDIDRRCRVGVTPFCIDGVTVTCDSVMDDRVMWNRFHHCPDVGWVGQELVVKRNDGPGFESWSTDLTVGDAPVLEPPLSERAWPDPGDLGR